MFNANRSRPDPVLADRTFTSTEVARIAEISLRQLQWWDEQKLVSPYKQGHKRLYRPEEVLEVTAIAELRRKGFSLQKLRRVVRFLNRKMRRRLSDVLSGESELHLLTDGKSIYLEDRPGRVIDLLKGAKQPMFLVCISDQAGRLGTFPKKPVRSVASGTARKARAV